MELCGRERWIWMKKWRGDQRTDVDVLPVLERFMGSWIHTL